MSSESRVNLLSDNKRGNLEFDSQRMQQCDFDAEDLFPQWLFFNLHPYPKGISIVYNSECKQKLKQKWLRVLMNEDKQNIENVNEI